MSGTRDDGLALLRAVSCEDFFDADNLVAPDASVVADRSRVAVGGSGNEAVASCIAGTSVATIDVAGPGRLRALLVADFGAETRVSATTFALVPVGPCACAARWTLYALSAAAAIAFCMLSAASLMPDGVLLASCPRFVLITSRMTSQAGSDASCISSFSSICRRSCPSVVSPCDRRSPISGDTTNVALYKPKASRETSLHQRVFCWQVAHGILVCAFVLQKRCSTVSTSCFVSERPCSVCRCVRKSDVVIWGSFRLARLCFFDAASRGVVLAVRGAVAFLFADGGIALLAVEEALGRMTADAEGTPEMLALEAALDMLASAEAGAPVEMPTVEEALETAASGEANPAELRGSGGAVVFDFRPADGGAPAVSVGSKLVPPDDFCFLVANVGRSAAVAPPTDRLPDLPDLPDAARVSAAVDAGSMPVWGYDAGAGADAARRDMEAIAIYSSFFFTCRTRDSWKRLPLNADRDPLHGVE